MSTKQDGRMSQVRTSIDAGITAYKVWRQKPLISQFIDVICGFIFTGMILALLYLMMLGSEYGGNG